MSDIASSTSSPTTDFADEDIIANKNREAVQDLQTKKKLLEIQIRNLQAIINDETAESFSRDQLPAVKNELEQTCNEKFQQRTNELMLKLEKARAERKKLEIQAANLKHRLEDERKITAQLVLERESLSPQKPPPFPDLCLPDMQLLRDTCGLVHKKRALEDEVREAERQLSLRRQDIAENEANLVKIIQESKAATAQCEAQIRQETLDLAQLEEMRASLKERLDSNRQRQKQLEAEKSSLTTQIEAAEAEQRAKVEEINRNFLASQREFEEQKARKQEEIRILTKELHENQELLQSKIQEKEKLIAEVNASQLNRQSLARSQPMTKVQQLPSENKKTKKKKVHPKKSPRSTETILRLQREIADLEKEKQELKESGTLTADYSASFSNQNTALAQKQKYTE